MVDDHVIACLNKLSLNKTKCFEEDNGGSNNNIKNSSMLTKAIEKKAEDAKKAKAEEALRKLKRMQLLQPDLLFTVLLPLEDYPPTSDVKRAHSHKFSLLSLSNLNEKFGAYIKDQQLTADNAFEVYNILLKMEDIANLLEYPALAQKASSIKRISERSYSIDLTNNASNIEDIVTPYLDELVLVPKLSSIVTRNELKHAIDLVLPHMHELLERFDPMHRFVAYITEITKKEVKFKFSEIAPLPNEFDTYDVLFRPTRTPIRYQYAAIEQFAEDTAIQKYLYPLENPNPCKQIPCTLQLEYLNASVGTNPEQSQAVQHIVNGGGAYAPFIIFGPPGTGKTTTVVESILQLQLQQPGSRILVTAGSNSACDTIALRICKYLNDSQSKMLRIFSKSVLQKGKHAIDDTLLEHSNLCFSKYFFPAKSVIWKFNIIVATLCTVGKLVSGTVGIPDFFTHIFIDEAGASTEPEALIGIMGMKSTHQCRIIISGDHKQLGPVLKCERASGLGLNKSLMERLLERKCYEVDTNGNYDRSLQIRLCRNYRSHTEIVRLYNSLYYDNKLKAEAEQELLQSFKDWPILTNPKFPIIFQAVHGSAKKDELSPSVSNVLEINVLFYYVRSLLHDGLNGLKICGSDIGIITPYRSQCKRIQQRLAEKKAYRNIEVGSVETFQGREKTVIIVSFVRSFNGLGFVRSPRRLNVIVSRAKSLLILIGNPLTLQQNPDFDYLIKECKTHGTYLRKKKTSKRRNKENTPTSQLLITDKRELN